MSIILHHRQQMQELPSPLQLTDAAMSFKPFTGKDKIRLYGIDAPEKTQECKDAKGQTYACGKASTDFLKQKVGSKALRCEVRMSGGWILWLWNACDKAVVPCFGAEMRGAHAWGLGFVAVVRS
jgi:hypothetical protein